MRKIDGDRILALMIIDGKPYISDCDHQECLSMYLSEKGYNNPFSQLSADMDNYDAIQEEMTHQTFKMKESHTAYGFDVFDAAGLDYCLLAHDEDTFKANEAWMKEYAKNVLGDCPIGYFTTGYNAEIFT